MKTVWRLILALGALTLAACNGTAVVTMTSTASTDAFLVYRVPLQSIELESADGAATLKLLAAGTTVDFANLGAIHEMVAAAQGAKATYTRAVLTLDYSSAQIIYDDGSLDGVPLTALDANGAELGQITVTVNLDSSATLKIATAGVARLALDFKMAASNLVDASAKTVTVTPLFAASTAASDSKAVRIRGPLKSFDSGAATFTQGLTPFDGAQPGLGALLVSPSDATTYEVNGIASTGASGLAQLGQAGGGAMLISYGTLSSTDTSTTEASASSATTAAALLKSSSAATKISYTITQVLAGSSVEGGGFDRVSGTVSARSGNTLTLENATLKANDATESLLSGTTVVTLSASSSLSLFGAGVPDLVGPSQISVGSNIEAFGNLSSTSAAGGVLDASAGRVRIDASQAAGLVTALDTSTLTVNLQRLNGRSAPALDFVGTGTSVAQDAVAARYTAAVTGLDVSNLAVGGPVLLTGAPASFALAPPDFNASSLLDLDTLEAQLVIDWGAGTAAPFASLDSSAIQIDSHNTAIGSRHLVQVGALSTDILALSSDPLITPGSGTGASFVVYSIGHAGTDSVENFDTYTAFIAQLQSELGSALVRSMTAVGQYTATSATLQASSIAVVLNN